MPLPLAPHLSAHPLTHSQKGNSKGKKTDSLEGAGMSHPGSQLQQLPLHVTLETRDVRITMLAWPVPQPGPCTEQALSKHVLTYCVIVG